jgi:plasmid stability protein
MAKTLTLRKVPDDVVRSLRARARRNHRSMQREMLSIISSAVIDREGLAQQLRKCRAMLIRPMRIEEIHRAIDEGRP